MSNLLQPIIARLTHLMISIPWFGPKLAKWLNIEFDEFKDEYEVPWYERFQESAVMLLGRVPLVGAWLVDRFGDPERIVESNEEFDGGAWKDRCNQFFHLLPFFRSTDADQFESVEGEGLSLWDHWSIFWQTLPFNTVEDELHFEQYDSPIEDLNLWQKVRNWFCYIPGSIYRRLSFFLLAKPDAAFSDNPNQNPGAFWIFYCVPVIAMMALVGATLGALSIGNKSTDDVAVQQLSRTEKLLLRYQQITDLETLSTFERLDVLGEKVRIAKEVMKDEGFSSQGIEMLLDSNLETAIVCVVISAQVPDRIRVVLEDETYSINSRAQKLIEFSQLVLRIVDWNRIEKNNWAGVEASLVEFLKSTKFEEKDRVKWAFLRHHSASSDYFPQPNNFEDLIIEHLVISD